MAYSVKEIFYSLQGEGAQAGTAMVFCRFAGCNLWTGREADRSGAKCSFCDTDFVGTDGPGGGKFDRPGDLADSIALAWAGHAVDSVRRWVIFTGGEPMLQLDESVIDCMKARGFVVAIETNGTLPVPDSVDWVCVSPKAGTTVVQRSGQELKVVFPQDHLDLESLRNYDFEHFSLQPKHSAQYDENVRATVEYCLTNPTWRLSMQMHKVVGIE